MNFINRFPSEMGASGEWGGGGRRMSFFVVLSELVPQVLPVWSKWSWPSPHFRWHRCLLTSPSNLFTKSVSRYPQHHSNKCNRQSETGKCRLFVCLFVCCHTVGLLFFGKKSLSNNMLWNWCSLIIMYKIDGEQSIDQKKQQQQNKPRVRWRCCCWQPTETWFTSPD